MHACMIGVQSVLQVSSAFKLLQCLQVWIGYNQSLRPAQSGLTLNMDITAAAFLEAQPMLQLISATIGMQNLTVGLNPQQVRSANKAIRGVQVRTAFNGHFGPSCKSYLQLV